MGGPTLSGWYGFIVGGGLHAGGGEYYSGAILFDGNCGLTGANVNGGTSGAYANTSVTGSYGMNLDGTYAITMSLANQTTPLTFVVGVSESGNKARGIQSDNTATANIDIDSQLTTVTQGYTTASLTGTYAASCTGSGVDLNYVKFDGQGNLTGQNPYDIGGSLANNSYTGTYTVNSDGTFTGALTGGYSAFTFTGVIDDGVSDIKYTYNQNGNPVVACSGKISTTSSLQGWYGVVVGGTATPGANGTYLSGAVYFDGNGNLNGTNINGGLNGQYGNTSVTGTYVPNGDGTTTITMNLANPASTQTYIVGVTEGGSGAAGIEYDGTAIATIDMQAQLQVPAGSYSTASLNGTYAAKCFGAEVDLNYVTFDGAGNLNGIDPYDNGTFGGSPMYSGTYSVNPDGTFSGGFAGSYANYTMTGVIDNATAEIEYTYDYMGVGGVVQCIGESSYGPVGSNPVAVTPAFTPAPGAYNNSQSVTLSDTTPGAVIYYTTNGVAPTTSSSLYGTAIPVSATTTIQAIAVAPGSNNSAIAAGTFFITPGLPSASTPTFSPMPGTYTSPASVTLLDTTPNAMIYYTTDGTTPSTKSQLYGNAIVVSTTTMIQAIAVATGYSNSNVGVGTYTITVPTAATPTFNPMPGTFTAPQSVVISESTSGAVIHCTTDGTPPSATSAVCSTVTVSATTTLQAIAVATGYNNSPVGGGVYTINLPTAATPTFTPLPGTYSGAQNVTLSDTTPNAVIHCTTNGTTVSASSPVCTTVAVSSTTTIQALAVATNYNNSAVASGLYTINQNGSIVNLGAYYNVYGIGTVGTAPKGGGFDGASYAYNSALLGTSLTYQNLSFPLGAPNALDAVYGQTVPLPAGQYNQIYLLGAGVFGAQTNQSIVVTYSDGTTSTFTQSLSDWANPQHYTNETTVIATANRIAPNGQTQTGTPLNVYGYAFNLTAGKSVTQVKLPNNRNAVFLAIGLSTPSSTATTPTFTPTPGTYNAAVSVTLADTTPGATIYYTTNGTTPTTGSSVYSSAIPLSATTTIQAIAVASGYYNSATAKGIYTINLPTAATPGFTPTPGTYNAITSVTLSDSTPGAVIHYTTNGTTPNASSPVYSSAIKVSVTTTVQAIVVASGYLNSGVATGVYTIVGTPITPYVQVNGGAWQQTATASATFPWQVNLGPQPLSGGSWSWTGTRGFTSTSRQINNIPLVYGTNTYVATYTNTGGITSTQTFTINVH